VRIQETKVLLTNTGFKKDQVEKRTVYKKVWFAHKNQKDLAGPMSKTVQTTTNPNADAQGETRGAHARTQEEITRSCSQLLFR
jgi:hypothetical protein